MKIEKGLPLPKIGKVSKYPFAKMEIGDSVFFADEEGGSKSKPATAAKVYAHRASKRKGKIKFAARAENGGVRIWRVDVVDDANKGKLKRAIESLAVGEVVFFADEPKGVKSHPASKAFALQEKQRAEGIATTFRATTVDGGVSIERLQ